MPLGADPQANIEELHRASKRKGTRSACLRRKYGAGPKFDKVIEGIAYSAARRHGWKG